MFLLDLPPELLALIADCLGASELRKSVAYLLLAKRWYQAVLPVYLSQLPLSDLYLASHHDLERLPPSDTALSNLIQTKAKRLSVRFVGHPSIRLSVVPWHDNGDLYHSDNLGLDGTKRLKNWHCDWMTAGPVERYSGRRRWHWHREQETLHQWGYRINKKLVELAAMMFNSKCLEEFSLEASSEHTDEHGPRWDYLHESTIRSLISSLPSSLNNLTLDLCGSGTITPDRGIPTAHLCPLIGQRLRDFRNVRLRLRCICPQVLRSSSLIPNVGSRLKTLIIKLSLPSFPEAVDEVHNGYNEFDAKSCLVTAIPLYKRMIAAGVNSAKNFPELSLMRISYRSQSDTDDRSSYNLAVADCVRKQYMFEPTEMSCYEDDGSQWDAWEDSDTLRDGGPFEELLW